MAPGRLPSFLLLLVALGLLALVALLGLEAYHQNAADEEHSIQAIHHHAKEHSIGNAVWSVFKKEHEHPFPSDLNGEKAYEEIYEKHFDVAELIGWNMHEDIFARAVVKGARLALQENRPYVLMEHGVWMGVEVARRVNSHPNCHVIGVDDFEQPQESNPRIQSLPEDIRKRFGVKGSRHSEFRIRNAEYLLRRRAGENAERTILLKGGTDASISILKWPGMHVDAIYLRSHPQDDVLECIQFLNLTIATFYEHNPNVIIGGENWQKKQCIRDAVYELASELGLQIGISAQQYYWVASKDMKWLRQVTAFDGQIKQPPPGKTFKELLDSALDNDPEKEESVALPANPDAFARYRVAKIHAFPQGLLDDHRLRELYLTYPEVFGEGTSGCQVFFDQVVRHGASMTSLEQNRRFLLVQLGVGQSLNVNRWLNAHAHVQVIGIDSRFNEPLMQDPILRKLPTRLRKHVIYGPGDGADLSSLEARMRLVEFGIRIGGHSPGRSLLIYGEELYRARETLAWPQLQVDAVYVDPTGLRNRTDCAAFLGKTFELFFKHQPDMYFGGEDYGFDCIRDTVYKYAAANKMQLVVMGGCTWAMGKDLTFLQMKSPFKRSLMHPGRNQTMMMAVPNDTAADAQGTDKEENDAGEAH